MIKQAIETIAKACGGKIVQYGTGKDISGVSTDSRTTKVDDLFIPLVGDNFDGHSYIKNAIEKGAIGVLIEKNKFKLDENTNDKVFFIEVDDTLEALQNLSKYYRNLFSIPVIGVTGSTGKTTTKDMVSNVLSFRFNTLKNIGNLNNQIGLPLTIFNLDKSNEMCVLEMGMSGFGEISELANIARPNIGIITNIGLSHIEHLGSQENICKAKMEIGTYLGENDYLLLNGDDKFLRMTKNTSSVYNRVYIGLTEDNDLYAQNIEDLKGNGYSFDVKIADGLHSFTITQPGIHNILNALYAIWIGIYYGMSPTEINNSFREFQPSKMRLEIIKLREFTVINDAYNASPDSMTAALKVLSSIDGNRKIAVLGNMFEMGDHSEFGHRLVGDAVVANNVDTLITVGDMAKWIADEAIVKGLSQENIFSVLSNREAVKIIEEKASDGDVILVKGSRGMKMDEIVTDIQERS